MGERGKHTPGPWELNVNDDIEMNDGFVVANISDVSPATASYEEARANGLLIAAAPEMLGALELSVRGKLLCTPTQNQAHRHESRCPLCHARAIIAKAKGLEN